MKLYFVLMATVFCFSYCDYSEAGEKVPQPKPEETLPDTNTDSGENPLTHPDRQGGSDVDGGYGDPWDRGGSSDDRAGTLGIFKVGDQLKYSTFNTYDARTKEALLALRTDLQAQNSQVLSTYEKYIMIGAGSALGVWVARLALAHPYGRAALAALGVAGVSNVALADSTEAELYDAALKLQDQQVAALDLMADTSVSDEDFLDRLERNLDEQNFMIGLLNTLYPSLCASYRMEDKNSFNYFFCKEFGR